MITPYASPHAWTRRSRWSVRALLACLITVIAMLGTPALQVLHAQTVTGTLRGHVTGTSDTPVPNAEVRVTNVATGAQRATTSREDGAYVIPGLQPGNYDVIVRRIGSEPETRRVVVQVGATQIENFSLATQAVQLTTVAVTAAATHETRTSEVATNVTRAQLERLPTPTRNFLDLAALAPGVTVSEDRINSQSFRTVQAGGQIFAAEEILEALIGG